MIMAQDVKQEAKIKIIIHMHCARKRKKERQKKGRKKDRKKGREKKKKGEKEVGMREGVLKY